MSGTTRRFTHKAVCVNAKYQKALAIATSTVTQTLSSIFHSIVLFNVFVGAFILPEQRGELKLGSVIDGFGNWNLERKAARLLGS